MFVDRGGKKSRIGRQDWPTRMLTQSATALRLRAQSGFVLKQIIVKTTDPGAGIQWKCVGESLRNHRRLTWSQSPSPQLTQNVETTRGKEQVCREKSLPTQNLNLIMKEYDKSK